MDSETKTLSLVVQNRELALTTERFHIFDNPIHQLIFDLTKQYYADYSELLSQGVLVNEVKKNLEDKTDLELEYIAQLIPQLFHPIENEEYYLEEARKFIRQKAVIDAWKRGAEFVKVGRIDDAVKLIKLAETSGKKENIGISYFEDLDVSPEEIEKISTGISKLDVYLRGGIGRKELVIILGKAKVGKTMFMIHLGWKAILNFKKVVHYTLEMPAIRIKRRYDARFTGLLSQDIVNQENIVKEKLLELKKKYARSLIIKEYPPRKCKIIDIERHLNLLKKMGFEPDMILIDYIDKMSPSQRRERRFEIEDLYEEVKAIAMERNLVVVSATQPTKEGERRDILRTSDPIETQAKLSIPDILLALNQTDEEFSQDRMQLNLLLVRDNPRGGFVNLRTDFERSGFIELGGEG